MVHAYIEDQVEYTNCDDCSLKCICQCKLCDDYIQLAVELILLTHLAASKTPRKLPGATPGSPGDRFKTWEGWWRPSEGVEAGSDVERGDSWFFSRHASMSSIEVSRSSSRAYMDEHISIQHGQ